MTLTVPKAGVIGGATASPRFEADQTGNAMADFGSQLMQIGTEIRHDREQRGLGRARVEMMQGFNDLQTEFDQIGDPDRIDTEYGPRVQELRDRTLANVPESVRADAEIAFDEMSVAHATRQGRRAVGLRQSAELATVMAAGDELVRAASIGDADTQAAYLDQVNDQLDSLVARGVMQPDEAQRIRSQVGGQMESARATRMLSEDPGALVQAIDAGEFTSLGGDQQQGWRARGVTASRANAARAEAETARSRSEFLGQVSQLAKDGTAVLRKGQPYARAAEIADLLADPEIAALPEMQEYAATVMLTEQRPEIAVLPPAEKRKLLAELERQPLDKPYEADTVTALRGMIEADEKQFREDPLGHAAEIGLKAAPALPDPTTASPEELVAGLRSRAQYSQSLVAGGYVDRGNARIFTPAEREQWGRLVAPGQSPEVRARMAGDLASALGPQAEAAAQEIGADPVFAYVGGGLANGMNERVGREVFEGQRIIEGQQVKMPAVPDRRQSFFGTFSSLFFDGVADGWADQSGARDQITAAADALYAYRMRGKVATGEWSNGQIVETEYLQAVHEVMGGTGKYNKRDARGGLQTVRDQITILPAGVSGGDVGDRLDMLAASMDIPDDANVLLRQIAVSGNRPDMGGQLPDSTSLRRMNIRAIGGDQYVLTWPNQNTGELTVVMGDDGKPFVMSLSALLKPGTGE